MSEINLPPEQRERIKAVCGDRLYRLVDQALHDEGSSALRELRLESCGDYIAEQLRIYDRALAAYAKAKSSKKRADTEMDAHRAGSGLISAVSLMQNRVETEEKEGQLFFVDDHVMQPFSINNNLYVSVHFRWRSNVADPWIYGDIKFTHQHSPTPSYMAYPPRRKLSAAAESRERESELYGVWDQLRRSALHSVKEFFQKGGNGADIPATFKARANSYGGGLDNYSLRFWIQG
ncbi:hypothetical protein YA0599_22565 [Pseudomonas syringae]|uniref:hypothetical protein n=1 Tax=Pseudomonas syringae TaxID=317 RepID=UPI0018E62BD4|nr:hypothetical protein [Pseudomonas syringae]MBI6711003.1 hypothetical protein [Pseudomonas syringae]